MSIKSIRRVYIAGPYANGDTGWNIKRAISCADKLCELGYIPYVPHLTHFWHIVSPKSVGFWYDYDLRWLECCDALLRLPGESLGADKEIEYATGLGIPVFNSLTDLKAAVGECHGA